MSRTIDKLISEFFPIPHSRNSIIQDTTVPGKESQASKNSLTVIIIRY